MAAFSPPGRPSGILPIINPTPQTALVNPVAPAGYPGQYNGLPQAPIAWIPPGGVTPELDASIIALQNQIQGMKEQRHQFAVELHRRFENLMVTAKNNANGTTRVPTQGLTDLNNAITQATVEAGNTENMDNQAADDISAPGTANQANLTLGGWTPKPRRKPTRRRPKKRKSVKSPF